MGIGLSLSPMYVLITKRNFQGGSYDVPFELPSCIIVSSLILHRLFGGGGKEPGTICACP